MFVTGPDVIKTVTHEEVTKEELGGAMTHNARSGVAHFAVDDDRACLALIRELLSYLPSNNLEEPPVLATEDPADREDEALDTLIPAEPNRPYDIKDLIRAVVDDRRFLEVHEHYAPNIVVGFARFAGAAGRHRREPAGGAGGLPRHRRLGQGRALRALLRRLQHPAGDLRGRAGLPARHRPGVRRHHPARRQAALRLRRGHRAEDHGDHAQGLRRRLLRDGEQAHPHRRQLRLAAGRDRRDGARGRGQHPLPARAAGRGGPRGAAARRRSRSSARSSRTPTSPPTAASSTR